MKIRMRSVAYVRKKEGFKMSKVFWVVKAVGKAMATAVIWLAGVLEGGKK